MTAVMVSNQTKFLFAHLATRYPGSIGHLFSPGATRGPYDFMPYALDNGAWGAHLNGTTWSEAEWLHLMRWSAMAGQRPLWAVVPDVVGDRAATLERWEQYAPVVRGFGFRPAFAAQDGMTLDDVPDADCMVFVGGSDDFKLAAIRPWSAALPGRVHVARVNTLERLLLCHAAGAVSVDGTGWWHRRQQNDLMKYIKETSRCER
jgi:hypothetical protein